MRVSGNVNILDIGRLLACNQLLPVNIQQTPAPGSYPHCILVVKKQGVGIFQRTCGIMMDFPRGQVVPVESVLPGGHPEIVVRVNHQADGAKHISSGGIPLKINLLNISGNIHPEKSAAGTYPQPAHGVTHNIHNVQVLDIEVADLPHCHRALVQHQKSSFRAYVEIAIMPFANGVKRSVD